MMNAADVPRGHARRAPDSLALVDGDREWTFDELDAGVAGAVEALQARGVGPGDRVLLVVPTSAEFVLTYFGALALGAIVVSVNTLSTAPELTYYAEDAGCSLIVAWNESADPARQTATTMGLPLWVVEPSSITPAADRHSIAETDAADAAVILYTSGTTGRPKGAVLTHSNLVLTGEAYADALGTRVDDRMGTALPLFHVFGQVSVMMAVYHRGAALFLQRPFDPAGMLQLAASRRLTALAGVPTMWIAMLHTQTDLGSADFASLRLACSGGAAMPSEVARAFKDRFGAQILEGYGLSETSGGATFNAAGAELKEMSVGRALPGTSITVLDDLHNPVRPGEVGEVAIDGPIVMKEYWGRPDATRAARAGRWFLTGDLGRMDEDGYVWIVDRKKDLVIRGGYNVYPREVEEQLFAHPQVQEAAVVGLPDERLGEEVAAVVAPKAGETIDADALRAWLAERLSAYKVPRVYLFVDALPKGATGKILKRGLDRDRIRAEGIRVSSPDRSDT